MVSTKHAWRSSLGLSGTSAWGFLLSAAYLNVPLSVCLLICPCLPVMDFSLLHFRLMGLNMLNVYRRARLATMTIVGRPVTRTEELPEENQPTAEALEITAAWRHVTDVFLRSVILRCASRTGIWHWITCALCTKHLNIYRRLISRTCL